ncbi:hypothetical protein ACP81O_24555, partial [Escherichia coli]
FILYILNNNIKPHFPTGNIVLANNIKLLANILMFKIDTISVKKIRKENVPMRGYCIFEQK